jgi:hypothetical protein
MDLATLETKYGELVAEMDVAAPVDLAHMFRSGLVERDRIAGTSARITDKAGVFVPGSIKVESLELAGHALLVVGDVEAKTIELRGTMVVLGNLVATEVRGAGEPHTLTVMGRVKIGRAIMEHEYVMQFLGGGTVELLVDTEGGGEELVEMLRDEGSDLSVGTITDDPEAASSASVAWQGRTVSRT